MWPDTRLTKLVGIEHPLVLAPMAGAMDHELVAAVSEAGGLGSLPCAMLTAQTLRDQYTKIRALTDKPVNVNFFCHAAPMPNNAREARWREKLKPYYEELGIDPSAPVPSSNRAPFDAAFCEVIEELKPQVVSFHFGLPEVSLLERVKATGAIVMSSATVVAEAVWLEQHGADVVIAQGYEAGGHRGMFLTDDIASQVGTFALVPQVVDAVKVPVIAAGGIADARGIAAAFALGAAGVQIGTAFLHCPEAKVSPMHRAALKSAGDAGTTLTNLMTGRPARGIVNRIMREIGPIGEAPAFPLAAGAVAPLRAKAETAGSCDFSPMWSGQAAALGVAMPAGALTQKLAAAAQAELRRLSGGR
jgi:nitronate monooxygenase